MDNKHNTSKPKVHSQSTVADTIRDWLLPKGIKEEKANQAKTEQSEGAQELKKRRK